MWRSGDNMCKGVKHWALCIAHNKCSINMRILLSFLLLQFPWSPQISHTWQWESSYFYKIIIPILGVFRLMFFSFFNHNPQSKIHLNNITCRPAEEMGASIKLHLIRLNVKESQTQHPSHVCPEKLLHRHAKEMRIKFHSSTVCKQPAGTIPMSTSPGAVHILWCNQRKKVAQ